MKVKRVPDGWLLLDCPSGGDSELDEAMVRGFARAFELWARKQASYGPHNISRFKDLGIVVRMTDKIERLRQIYFEGYVPPKDETARDTFMDCCNYAMMGVLCLDGEWPLYRDERNAREERARQELYEKD